MTYLIDSDWLADHLKGIPSAVSLITSLIPDGIAISLITLGEIYEGICYGHNPGPRELDFRHFLRGAEVLPLNQTIMRDFARIRGDLRRRGQIIGDADILIAATALHFDRVLVTRNLRYFNRIPGLKLHCAGRDSAAGAASANQARSCAAAALELP